MRLIRHLKTQAEPRPATALAIGNFDGLHRGHQALVRAVCACADELAPALMCFEPLPATFFRPDQPVRRLLNRRDKLRLCRRYGLEQVYMLRFNREFAALSPAAFVSEIVVAGAGARQVVVGDDFRFGARAAGDIALLRELGKQHGFGVQVMEEVNEEGGRVSSSAVRQAMAEGDLARVRHLLGRAYAISGRVLRGRQLGRQLGFPTVNIRPPEPPALAGVLAVRVSGAGLDRHPGVASLGLRPTVGGTHWLLEVHLFDFDGTLYGQHLNVEFVEYLRSEQSFASLEELTRQMHQDAGLARSVLGLSSES
jgi:riboflavin kinase / FMN adenylyltransferase